MSVAWGPVVAVGVAVSLGLAAVHLFGGALRMLDGIPRSRWLSFSGGVSVAYVFVHLLHEVGRASSDLGREPFGLGFLERHVYLLALAGFLAYYGVERAAKQADGGGRDDAGEDDTGEDDADDGDAAAETTVFWMHVGAFACYNVLVGYLLLHREVPGLVSLVLFGVAMATHFVVNDWGLRDHHGDLYRRRGRWVLAVAVLAGTGLGFLVSLDEAALALLFSFLAGGVVLNVIKEEVPEERESRFWAFAGGAAAYTVVLLAV